MYDVHGKTVMITGAATGLGYKYAEILLRHGAKSVAVIDLPMSKGPDATAALESEFGKGRAVFFACDVTKADELSETLKRIVDAFGGLDILINNAGVLNDNAWELTIEINLKALIRGSMLAFDYMGWHKGGKGGVIVNIASVTGLEPFYFLPMYSASKHAVVGFSRALASMHDKTGVRVVTMCPGVTVTALVANLSDKVCDSVHAAMGSPDAELKKYPKQTVDDVAPAMLELIRKGKNGAVWVSEGGNPPYAVGFPHYFERSLPI